MTMSSTTEQLTLTDTNGLQNARALYLNLTGTPGGAAVLEVPAVQKAYIVKNNTTGGFAVTVKVASQTGVSVPNGATMHLYNNGTDVVNAVTNLPAGATIGGTAISTASGTVSSVAAGDGMNFATITTTGSVTLGTPSTLNTTTTNLVSGSTHTHAITTASASTASTIVARDAAGAFEATTIGMTTGNIGTLNVGTQAGKATISYTTNAARTLTVPAVAGNRTFAFIDEAQTFTANQTMTGDLTFTGNQKKLVALWDGLHQNSNAFAFQNSITNAGTSVSAIPNGTNQNSAYFAYSSTDGANSHYGVLISSPTHVAIDSLSVGTGVTKQLRIDTDNFARIIISPAGDIAVNTNTDANIAFNLVSNGRPYSLSADNKVRFTDAYAEGVGATNRSLYIDNTGLIGGLTSTRESKTNIVPIADADWLMSLEPVSYNRRLKNEKDVYTDIASPNMEFGLIADDVANVRPEICVFAKGKVAGINYEQLIAPMLKEIQKLRAEVNALKEKVNG